MPASSSHRPHISLAVSPLLLSSVVRGVGLRYALSRHSAEVVIDQVASRAALILVIHPVLEREASRGQVRPAEPWESGD